MLKAILSSLAAFIVLAVIVGAIIFGAKSVSIPVTQEHYQTCLDQAEQSHTPPIDCPKSETLWDRGFEDPVAYYTFWLALFTVALAIGGLVQSVLIGQQIKLARDEFISTHRPKLRLRLLTMTLPEVGKPIEIKFSLVNIGDTPATVIDIDITLRLIGLLDVFKDNVRVKREDYIWNGKFPAGVDIAAGKSAPISGKAAVVEQAWAERSPYWWYERVMVAGVVIYTDDRGIKRQTGFYRRCERDPNRFLMHKFDKATRRDREYED
jgi:hypothetical protein